MICIRMKSNGYAYRVYYRKNNGTEMKLNKKDESTDNISLAYDVWLKHRIIKAVLFVNTGNR